MLNHAKLQNFTCEQVSCNPCLLEKVVQKRVLVSKRVGSQWFTLLNRSCRCSPPIGDVVAVDEDVDDLRRVGSVTPPPCAAAAEGRWEPRAAPPCRHRASPLQKIDWISVPPCHAATMRLLWCGWWIGLIQQFRVGRLGG
jgi:hypothetical protein